MKKESKLDQRLNRIRDAVALKTPDRVPVVLEYAGFAANATSTPFPEFLLSLERSVDVMIEAWKLLTEDHEADAINYGRFSPYNLSIGWMSKVAVPGVDLPPEMSYQVAEQEILTREDYDTILESGWPSFQAQYLKERIFSEVPPEYLPWNQPEIDVQAKWADIDVPVLKGGTVAPPFEYLCGGRSLGKFCMDMFNVPDKLISVMDEIVRYETETNCRAAKEMGYSVVWVGGWRTAPAMLSPDMWDRFVWPYLKQVILETLEYDLIPLLHLDGNWERELGRFRELPAGKMIFGLDGFTDIFKAKEILDGHSCVMGDIPAVMLSTASPDEVFSYCSNLVKEIGPDGFILHSGCDIPENAKVENVKAMIAAAAN